MHNAPADHGLRSRRWAAPGVLELLAACAWSAVALISFSDTGPDLFVFIGLILAGLALACVWVVRAAVVACVILLRDLPPSRWPGRPVRWLFIPLCGVLGCALLVTNRDLALRLWLCEGPMRAFAHAAMASDPAAGSRKQVGLFRISRVDAVDGSAVRIVTAHTGLFDRAGVYYSPNGPPPPWPDSHESVQPLFGPWYRFRWSD